MPVYRLTASSIISSFRVSGKRHLLLTGGRGTGKTTLLRLLLGLEQPDRGEITCVRWCHCFAPGHRKLPQQRTLRTVWKFEKVWAEK